MSLYDAMCHTFGTMATGGFSTHSASVGYFASAYVDSVVIVFMILAGANFALHYAALHGRLKIYATNPEFRFYISAIAISVVIAAISIVGMYGLGPAVRHAAFQVVSIITTTGYTTQDYNIWPAVIRLLLLVLMFFGGCAGSTGGGIKSIRIFVLLKQAVIPLRVGGRPVKDSMVQSVLAFFVLYMGIFVLASLVMTAIFSTMPKAIEPIRAEHAVTSDNVLITAVSSVAATLNNIGPGLSHVGPGDPRAYSWIPAAGKIVLTICMLIGRLEVFTVVFIFLPWFYR
jgi:trk system potassium uptake protein TrkH